MCNHEAAITETAFKCPHCGAYTTQYWFDLWANSLDKNDKVPYFPNHEDRQSLLSAQNMDDELREYFSNYFDMIDSKLVKIEQKEHGQDQDKYLINLHISKCYNCHEISVWVYDKIVFPENKINISPNNDLPDDIKIDFEEARSIINSSPRGAAALLRLCIQKLCKFLGEKGKNIDEDIGNLVKKGLNPLVQKSLDIVRVIGNEAVHPGIIDLNDDRTIGLTLFGIVNLIAEQMITNPKTIKSLYEKLPMDKRNAIEKRDTKDA